MQDLPQLLLKDFVMVKELRMTKHRQNIIHGRSATFCVNILERGGIRKGRKTKGIIRKEEKFSILLSYRVK